MKLKRIIIASVALLSVGTLTAQEDIDNKWTVSGSIQSDVLIPESDSKTGAEKPSEWALTNSYADVLVSSKHLDLGARVEFLKHPLPGYEKDMKGWGLGNIFARMHTDNVEVTLGNLYEQFGSGFILRTYEERSLGIDNSLLGARVKVTPVKGVRLTGLSGWQRRYWKYNDALISGGDVELDLGQWFTAMQRSQTNITLGGSFINKHERNEQDIYADATNKLNIPENVNAFDVRANVQLKGLNVLLEYAQKTADPSFDNGYIYRKGQVAMLSASYSRSGLSLLMQAKRSDNFSFRSDRHQSGTSSMINHLPSFTQDHTYALAALYPYATNPDGEWAYQAQAGYLFKRNTALGGKYGMNVKVNFSHVHAIDRSPKGFAVAPQLAAGGRGTDGYGSRFWKWGDETYYQDINVEVDRRMSKAFRLHLMYMNQFYNKTIVEGEGGMIHSDIIVADAKYAFSKKTTLRGELQYLFTDDDEGDWMYGLLELSLVPHWMITVSDQYNVGETDIHYYQGLVTFNAGAHRIQLGYGRTRAGYNCAGGVCRYVPATKGVTLSYNYNF
jgi:hypothetical protein